MRKLFLFIGIVVLVDVAKGGAPKQSSPSLFDLELISCEGRITGTISNKSTRTWSVYLPREGFEGGISLDISYNDTNRVSHVYNTSYIKWENIEHAGEWVALKPGRNVKFDQSLPSDIVDDLTIEGFPALARCSITGSLTAAIRYWDTEAFKKEKVKRATVEDPWERSLFENCLLWECDVDIKVREKTDVGTVSLKIERPFVVTNEVMRAICVVSNGLHNAISLFEVGADGFGYDIERWESHKCKWQGTGQSWCASGRRVKKLERGVVYDFEIRCKPAKEKQRVALEYWVGDPLMSAPRTVFSESFNTMPQTSF